MHTLQVITIISAPVVRCFDLARSVEAHLQSAEKSGEKAVGGKTSGLLGLGDEVTWEARHLFVRQRLRSRITAFEPPRYFRDTMIRGAFKSLEHDHYFERGEGGTTAMIDVLRFEAPCGRIGWLVERLLLAGHLRRFLVRRGLSLKAIAETQRDTSK